MSAPPVDAKENRLKMEAGELYYAFTPDLINDRRRCKQACKTYNGSDSLSRREQIELYKDLTEDETHFPKKQLMHSQEDDEAMLEDFPFLCPPVHMDYGYNVKLGSNVFINQNSTWIDTCTITVGARTLVGPNCSFYSGTHPLDPTLRNGTRGPETGKPITIGEDCWLGGNVIVLPGVTIGKGSTVGAGSVVTKDVEPYTVVAGNPARVIRKIEASAKPTGSVSGGGGGGGGDGGGVEVLAGEDAPKVQAPSKVEGGFLGQVVDYLR
ncbi:unnamed protein product [Discula destructiva]